MIVGVALVVASCRLNVPGQIADPTKPWPKLPVFHLQSTSRLLTYPIIMDHTTHDLTLAEIVDTMDGRAENAHFQDQLLDGKMVFDCRMRPGVVCKSNALDVMRSLGLDV